MILYQGEMVIKFFLLLILFFVPVNAEWDVIPFDEATRVDQFPEVYPLTEQGIGINGHELYDFCKNLYEQNSTLRVSTESDIKIPKIFHQIWLGSPLPEEFKAYQQSWIDHHPDWAYKLWTDEDVAQMELYNQEFYDETKNYGVKADILRYEILYEYGGVFVDIDFECLRPLDDLLCYDFYVGIEPFEHSSIQTAPGLFGTRPGHPILKYCIETIRNDWCIQGANRKTGPFHFTKSFYAMAGKDGNKDIAFPAFYFYPLSLWDTKVTPYGWTQPGSFAVHWWAGTWMPRDKRPTLSKNIQNDSCTEDWNR